jgi:hypothetical protein
LDSRTPPFEIKIEEVDQRAQEPRGASDRLFAGLANGELWESRDRGDTWRRCEVLGDSLLGLVALVAGSPTLQRR